MSTPAECCPQFDPCTDMTVLPLSYRIGQAVVVGGQTYIVDVTLHYTLTRMSERESIGPVVHTETLLPGESVRLYSSDRHTEFSYDSDTQTSSRRYSSSQESLYAASFAHSVSDLDQFTSTRKTSDYHESSVSGGGGASFSLFGLFEIGGGASASSYDASGVSTLATRLSQHAESSHLRSETQVRNQSSVAISHTATRTHIEGSSEATFESSSRIFSNPNQCRALTFLFHQLVKCQTVTFALVRIDRTFRDSSAPETVTQTAPKKPTGLTVLPQTIRATDPELVQRMQAARIAAADTMQPGTPAGFASFQVRAVDPGVREEALKQADAALMRAGLLTEDGEPHPDAVARMGWSRELQIPVDGVIVRTCLDECDACEPEMHQRIALELERMELENRMLERRIELLDREDVYRCCGDSGEIGS